MSDSHFSINNIPYGIASSSTHPQRSVVTRLGDKIIFIDELGNHGKLSSLPAIAREALGKPTLNDLAALHKSVQQQTRAALQSVLKDDLNSLPKSSVTSISEVTMHLPLAIGDFTDFSCSRDHVLNAGEAILKKRALPPGFLHFPIGYTARTSSIVVSGSSVVRPKGQFRDSDGRVVYGPSRQMDYELEIACVVGKPSKLGETVSVDAADDHIFGLVLLNDWSARDIQGLEMMPLGPMNGKSFSTSISPWVITLDALKPFEVQGPAKDNEVAPYLKHTQDINTYNIQLRADLVIDDVRATICKSEVKTMYWNFRDLIAHQTSNGCNINTGDLLATGTISGDSHDSHGCLLELTQGGEQSFDVQDHKRTYLEDGDIIEISGLAGPGVGFGVCSGRIISAM